MAIHSCTDCGCILEQSAESCEQCGSTNRSILGVEDFGFATNDRVKVQQRLGEPGEAKPFRIQDVKKVWNHDRQRHETMTIVVDRDADYYRQTWRDDDGNVTWAKAGSLRDPDMHGRASWSRDRNDLVDDGKELPN